MDPLKAFLAWTAFALLHSLTVSERYDRWAQGFLGEARFLAYHRALFTAYSALLTAAVLLYVHSLPDAPLYRITGGPRWLFHGVQALGVALLFWTPWDLREFVGLRQWERCRKGNETGGGRNDRLFTGAAYRLVRHPLYLGCSLILAFHPTQTWNGAASTAAIVAYFYFGTFHEERRLLHLYGSEYEEYRKRVPRFLPLPRP
jgi:protein-S-isoprenylcysteine O-methyltransferase Ste14